MTVRTERATGYLDVLQDDQQKIDDTHVRAVCILDTSCPETEPGNGVAIPRSSGERQLILENMQAMTEEFARNRGARVVYGQAEAPTQQELAAYDPELFSALFSHGYKFCETPKGMYFYKNLSDGESDDQVLKGTPLQRYVSGEHETRPVNLRDPNFHNTAGVLPPEPRELGTRYPRTYVPVSELPPSEGFSVRESADPDYQKRLDEFAPYLEEILRDLERVKRLYEDQYGGYGSMNGSHDEDLCIAYEIFLKHPVRLSYDRDRTPPYSIEDGQHRIIAARAAGLSWIPADVTDYSK